MAGIDRTVSRALAWIVPVVLVVGLLSMPREEYKGDPIAVRCETVSLINHGNLAIPDEVFSMFGGEPGQYFTKNPRDHQWYSKWGVMCGLMNVPPLLVEKWWEGDLPYVSPSRVIYLDFYDWILSLGIAVYFVLLIARYTRSVLVTVLLVLSAFYCTYWWNYQRAQNAEVYESIFMLAFFYHLVAARGPDDAGRLPRPGHLLASGIFLGIMMQIKSIFILLCPVAVGWLAVLETRRLGLFSTVRPWAGCLQLARLSLWFVVPVFLSGLVYLATNDYKFGCPLTTGFEQWGQDHQPLFAGHMLPAIGNMLFGMHASIFLHFPLLLFALFGYRAFFRDYAPDLILFLVSSGLLFLLYAKLTNPLGEWCYGARYLILFVPLLSLPLVKVLEFLFRHFRELWSIACLALMVLVLAWSCRLQMNVNALPFFTYYQVQNLFAPAHDPRVDRYFASHTFGGINGDILAAKKGRPFPPLAMIMDRLPPSSRVVVIEQINALTPSNYYWWP